MPKLSIVIPCYNEDESIPVLIERIRETYQPGTEIILVDNGSTDETPTVLNKELEAVKSLSILSIRIGKNIGYGHGIMSGIKEAKGEVIAWTHADMQTDINDVYEGYEKFIVQPKPEKTFLKGIRKNRLLLDELLTWGMGVISSLVLEQRLDDINAQPKMFHRCFLDVMQNPPDDFSLDLYALYLAKKNRLSLKELTVDFNKRLLGEAKGGGGSSIKVKLKLLKRTFAYIFKLKKEIKLEKR